MGLGDFFHKKKKTNTAIALDIGTEFVKALVFEITQNKVYILGIGRQRQKLTDMASGTVTDIAGVIENSKKAIEDAATAAKVVPANVVVGIAGEWVKGATTTVHYSRAHPQNKISNGELRIIIDKVQERSFERAREILAQETGHEEIDVKLVNAAVVDVSIDGYRVTNPLGFQGKDVSVSIFNAFAPNVHLGALQTIVDELGLDLLTIAAEPYAVARAVGLEESTDYSAIFIDVGGGTTDIAVVRNGGLEGTKMFALGGRTFTKRLSKILRVPFSTAEEIKINYAKDMLDEKSTKKVRDALFQDAQVWLSGVELTLEEFAGDEPMPSRILLCGGASALPDIQKALAEEQWSKNLPFAKKPLVEYIKKEEVNNVIDKTGQLGNPQDITPMSLANLALDFTTETGIVESILAKAVRSVGE